MRFLVDQHPLLLVTGVYLSFLYGAVTTIRGDTAEREYEWRENSMFSWFLRSRWPLDTESRFVSGRKVAAWLILVTGTFACIAYMYWKLGISSSPSP